MNNEPLNIGDEVIIIAGKSSESKKHCGRTAIITGKDHYTDPCSGTIKKFYKISIEYYTPEYYTPLFHISVWSDEVKLKEEKVVNVYGIVFFVESLNSK